MATANARLSPSDATIVRHEMRRYENWHHTVDAPVGALFDLYNPDTGPTVRSVRRTVAAIQKLIGEAEQARVRLRALGGTWSFSTVAVPEDGWLLNTAYLNWVFRADAASVDPAYPGSPDGLTLTQCGASIHELNRYLEVGKRRSLKTSGASNGQTFVGAMATGTHGSMLDTAAIEEHVVGIHLVTGPDQHLWIERATYPVVSRSFVSGLGAALVRDDGLFEAALVHIGGLGVVHAVLIETVDRFLLDASQLTMSMDAPLLHAIDTLDFSGLDLPGPGARPDFFQVIIIPSSAPPRDAYVKVMYRRPCPPDYVPDYSVKPGYAPGYSAPEFIGKLLTMLPGLTPALVALIARTEIAEFRHKIGTRGQSFDFTSHRSQTASTALAVPLARTSAALEVLQAAYEEEGDAPLVFTCRYVRGTPAMIGFTRFDPCCVIDIDGVYNPATLRVIDTARRRLDASGIPYAQHWGKLNEVTPARMQASYGANAARWVEARKQLLPSPGLRAVFSNRFMEVAGLA